MDVEITQLPELRVGSIRTDMQRIQDAWMKLNEVAGPAGLLGKHDTASVMPVEAIKGTSEGPPWFAAAVVVPDGVDLPPGLTEERLPAARYARAVYVGGFEGLPGAWEQFTGQALPASGHQPGEGVCIELHKSAPEGTPESEMRSELYVPVA